MVTLELHRSIYSENSVEEAVNTYADYGTLEKKDGDKSDYIVVKIKAGEEVDCDELAGEFANYALAASFESNSSVKASRI